jgi:hypothetical protein
MGRASGSLSSPAGAVGSDANRFPTAATVDQNFYNTDTNLYEADTSTFYPGGGPSAQTYTFTQTEAATTVPVGLGNNRPIQTAAAGTPLTGYVGGIMRSNPTTGSSVSYVIGNATNSPSDVVVQLDPSTSRIQANFNVKNISSSIAATTLSTASYQFGSVDPADRARSAYLDYDTFAARDARVGPAGNAVPVATVNGSALDNAHGALLNVRRADANHIAFNLDPANAGVICQCEFTRWGFWSIDDTRNSSSNQTTDRGHMMLWVAGKRPPSANEVPMTGSATYSGHVIVNVRNGANEYISGSSFTNTVNFGASSNQMSVSVGTPGANLDGATYAGSLSLNSDRRDFSGTLLGTGTGLTGNLTRTMGMNGSFFQGNNLPVGEMGGAVGISNSAGGSSSYIASGIFAGKRQ